MNKHNIINLEQGYKMKIPSEISEQLGLAQNDTLEIFCVEKSDKFFLVPNGARSDVLTAYGSVILKTGLCVELTQSLCEDMSLCERQELSIGIDLLRKCIVVEPVAPSCVFCGELGDKTINGKHICADCVDFITSAAK